jgi:hypothetical protein
MGVPGGSWTSIMGGSSRSSARRPKAALSDLFIAIERGRARAAGSRRDESGLPFMHDRLRCRESIDFQLHRHVVDEVGALMVDAIFRMTALEEPT